MLQTRLNNHVIDLITLGLGDELIIVHWNDITPKENENLLKNWVYFFT